MKVKATHVWVGPTPAPVPTDQCNTGITEEEKTWRGWVVAK